MLYQMQYSRWDLVDRRYSYMLHGDDDDDDDNEYEYHYY